jgi:hypothetical protein
MGDIGPSQQHYDVLPGPAYGIEDADRWTAPAQPPERADVDDQEPSADSR